jgi:hypothetical protein
MTDNEISRDLALAIGWKHVSCGWSQCEVCDGHGWRVFDYRDWSVISPIAAKFDCFPRRVHGQWTVGFDRDLDYTPQKAIALAVIDGAKK